MIHVTNHLDLLYLNCVRLPKQDCASLTSSYQARRSRFPVLAQYLRPVKPGSFFPRLPPVLSAPRHRAATLLHLFNHFPRHYLPVREDPATDFCLLLLQMTQPYRTGGAL